MPLHLSNGSLSFPILLSCQPAPTSMPSQSFATSGDPSFVPSSSSQPSFQPSESSEPSLAPSNSPRVTSLTVIEPDGVSKTVNCCESGDDNNECQSLLAIAEAESLDECEAPSTSDQPSLVPSTHPSVEPSNIPSESGVPSLMVSVCFLRFLMTLFHLFVSMPRLLTLSFVSYILLIEIAE